MAYIVLVGMMGSGKSTVGRLLADDLDVDFFDTDMMVQHRLGRTISQIFSLYGEDAFRYHETAALRSISDGEGVIATGGGIVLRPENWEEFRRLGVSIFLNPSLATLKSRLAASKRKRPLLENDEWESKLDEIRQSRLALYQQADVHVNIDTDDFDDVVEKIKEVTGRA